MAIKILWIDDEIDLLKPHQLFLEKKGYDTTMINNATDALEVIEKENLIQKADEMGYYISRALNRYQKITEIRGRGLMIGIEFEFPVDELRKSLLNKHRIFVGNAKSNIIRLLPPLTMNKAFADKFLQALEEEIV